MRGCNVSRTISLFPPTFWSVFERIRLRIFYYFCFKTLVGKCHVGVNTITEEIKMERRAEYIIRRKAHTLTRREYAE